MIRSRIYIVLLALWLVNLSEISAQIQPPIGSGLTWAREVYKTLDKRESEKTVQPVTDSIGFAVGNVFRMLFGNYVQYNAYNDSIFIPTFRDDWAEMIRHRADFQTNLYAQNQAGINFIRETFKPENNLPNSTYDTLFYYVHQLYRSKTEDRFIISDMLNVLLPHYEALNEDKDRLLLCYQMEAYCDFEISRIDKDTLLSRRSMECYRKIIEMGEAGTPFTFEAAPFFVLSAYCNTMVSFSIRQDITMAEAYDMRKRLDVFYKNNQKQFDKIPDLSDYYHWICNLFDLKAPIISIEHGDTESELFATFCKNYRRCVRIIPKEQFERFMDLYYSDLMIDRWSIEATLGKIDATQAFVSSYCRIMGNLGNVEEVDLNRRSHNIQYLYNTIVTSIGILEMANLSEDEKHHYMVEYLNLMSRFLSMHPRERKVSERSDIEYRIMTLPSVKRYLSANEQIYYLREFILLEQPQTFAHVTMVSKLCDVILDAVINNRPDLLKDVPNCGTIPEVWKNEKWLKNFMHEAALFHDLGKNIIPFIVNNSFRRLTDDEFKMIRKHPELAIKLLDINPVLQEYMDIAKGHHKWYNGKGGYPASFDNVASPYRILIDILTISDCTDAATDNFGRNYHNTKKFKQMLIELDAQAGVRYNPDLVQLIHDLPELYDTMSDIVDRKRMDAYYDIYLHYFR